MSTFEAWNNQMVLDLWLVPDRLRRRIKIMALLRRTTGSSIGWAQWWNWREGHAPVTSRRYVTESVPKRTNRMFVRARIFELIPSIVRGTALNKTTKQVENLKTVLTPVCVRVCGGMFSGQTYRNWNRLRLANNLHTAWSWVVLWVSEDVSMRP